MRMQFAMRKFKELYHKGMISKENFEKHMCKVIQRKVVSKPEGEML